VAYQPSYLLRPAVVRQLVGTLIGRGPYEVSKLLVKHALHRAAPG
jgi:hypothetical protein